MNEIKSKRSYGVGYNRNREKDIGPEKYLIYNDRRVLYKSNIY